MTRETVARETWRDVPSAPGYRVSDQGNVMSPRGKLIGSANHQRGYRRVSIAGHRVVFVHQLVAEAWLGPAEGRRVRHIDTPHVPHAWEARVLYEETTGTLLCGDLLTQLGDGPASTTDDVVEAAVEAEDVFGASCLPPTTGSTVRTLAELQPSTLAVMHGSCFVGDGAGALHALADDYDRRVAAAGTAG